MKLLKVDTVEEVKKKIDDYFENFEIPIEEINPSKALDRILSEDVFAPIDLPEYNRSTVDGYAVWSKDTFGVSESLPTFLDVIGHVNMGEEINLEVTSGKAVYVPTGGMIPTGADGMVMIEYIENLDEKTIAIYRSSAPGDGMIKRGEDIQKGEKLLSRGRKIKPQDIGALGALGVNVIKVFQKPKVAIISTGDEIVDPNSEVKFGQIRDINSYTLSSMVVEMGGEVTYQSVVQDDYDSLRNRVGKLIDENHMIVISGGSSVGMKDATARVIDSFGNPGVFVHGVAIKPGKPTILGKVKNTALLGLPGHPVSAMMVFRLFGEYFMNKMLCIDTKNMVELQAIANVNIHSAPGKETYQMVILEEKNGEYIAKPIHGKSGAITLLTRAQGYVKIDTNKEGVNKGDKVRVRPL